MAQEKATLIYVGDPMCSWCYGFAPEISKVRAQLGDRLDFQLVMGGLRPYNRETMADLEDFLAHHWHDVEKRSGQVFNHGILKDHSFVYDTEPASRAVLVVRELRPEAAFEFFKAVQKAFYFHNQDVHRAETYFPLVAPYGISAEDFQRAFESEEMKTKIKADFQFAADLGVRGFPSLVLKRGEDYLLVSNGYLRAERILQSIGTMVEP
ncbi:MAG: DsbA family protein [Bacteroidota bacterium]